MGFDQCRDIGVARHLEVELALLGIALHKITGCGRLHAVGGNLGVGTRRRRLDRRDGLERAGFVETQGNTVLGGRLVGLR